MRYTLKQTPLELILDIGRKLIENEERLYFMEREIYGKAGFKPDQPRVPAGQSGGGQWNGGGGNTGGNSSSVGAGQGNDAPSHDSILYKTPRGASINNKIHNDISKRKWAVSEIDEAVKHGDRIDAVNKRNGADATRYVNPKTGKSVIIENSTGRVVQVGDEKFKFGIESGDKPGAVMRPAPSRGGGGGGGAHLGGHPNSANMPLFPWELLD